MLFPLTYCKTLHKKMQTIWSSQMNKCTIHYNQILSPSYRRPQPLPHSKPINVFLASLRSHFHPRGPSRGEKQSYHTPAAPRVLQWSTKTSRVASGKVGRPIYTAHGHFWQLPLTTHTIRIQTVGNFSVYLVKRICESHNFPGALLKTT